jgi:hypothetical protein
MLPAFARAGLRQRPAQARDVHLQALSRPRGRIVTPQLIDEPLAAHQATAHQRQHRQQRPRPFTTQRHQPTIHMRLNRTEHLDPKPTGAVGYRRDHGLSRTSSRPTLRAPA